MAVPSACCGRDLKRFIRMAGSEGVYWERIGWPSNGRQEGTPTGIGGRAQRMLQNAEDKAMLRAFGQTNSTAIRQAFTPPVCPASTLGDETP